MIVVVFSDLDDYYAYVSHYCQEGEQAASGGVFISNGIPHIACPWTTGDQAARAITHELAHQCVAHLPLPAWLNEGVAMLLERRLSPADGAVFGMGAPLLDGEITARHAEFWNRERIQEFWAGTSFGIPGDSRERKDGHFRSIAGPETPRLTECLRGAVWSCRGRPAPVLLCLCRNRTTAQVGVPEESADDLRWGRGFPVQAVARGGGCGRLGRANRGVGI